MTDLITPGSGGTLTIATPSGLTWFDPGRRLRAYAAEDIAMLIAGDRVEPFPAAVPERDGRWAYTRGWQAEVNKIVDTAGWARLCEPSMLGCQPACDGHGCPGCVIRRIRVDHAPRMRGASAFDQRPYRWGTGRAAVVRIGTKGDAASLHIGFDEAPVPELASLPYYRSQWVLLHELAHLAAGPKPGGRSYGHSRVFARKFLELVDWRLGRRVAGEALRAGFAHVGIRPFGGAR